jgi:hypothetical protein
MNETTPDATSNFETLSNLITLKFHFAYPPLSCEPGEDGIIAVALYEAEAQSFLEVFAPTVIGPSHDDDELFEFGNAWTFGTPFHLEWGSDDDYLEYLENLNIVVPIHVPVEHLPIVLKYLETTDKPSRPSFLDFSRDRAECR